MTSAARFVSHIKGELLPGKRWGIVKLEGKGKLKTKQIVSRLISFKTHFVVVALTCKTVSLWTFSNAYSACKCYDSSLAFA
jgi:hypothetical protein